MKTHWLRPALGLLAAAALLAWIAVLQAPDGRLHVYFFAVDSGQGLLLQTPSGRLCLIDGGPQPSYLLSAVGRRLPFWQRTIDAVVTTHQGNSALSSPLEIVQRYRVLAAVTSPVAEAPSAIYQRWLASLQERHVAATVAEAGMHIDLGEGVRLIVAQSSPAHSSLLITYGQISISLPGRKPSPSADDASVVAFPAGAQDIRTLAAGPGNIAIILFSGAQGERSTTPPALAGVDVFSTALQGTIDLESDGRSLQIRPSR